MKKNKKQRFISDKISELRNQGKNQQESIAIALSMAENMLKEGGDVELPKYQKGVNFVAPTGYNANPATSPFTRYTGQKQNTFNFAESYKKPQLSIGQLDLNNKEFEKIPVTQKTVEPTKTEETKTEVKTVTPQTVTSTNNGGASFYKGMFSQPGYTPPNDLGFNQGEQYTGVGYNKDYVNSLSTKSLTAGKDFVKNNPLPKGVVPTELNLETPLMDNYIEETQTPNFQRQTPPIQFANPYGGVDLNAASALFGQSIKEGDTAMGVFSGAKLGLGLARNFMSGYSASEDRNRTLNDYSSNMRNAMTGAKTPNQLYQEGGTANEQDQLLQQISMMLQQGASPEQVMQELLNAGIPQEQGAQMIQMVIQSLQEQTPQQGQASQEEQMMQEQVPEFRDGGIPERYRNMGFNKVGVKRDSTRPGKKWMVLAKKGDDYKIVHGGAKGMQDFKQHGSEERKKRFWDRMGGKNSAKANDPFSPLHWHKKFGTWQNGGEYQDEIFDDIEEDLQKGISPEQILKNLVSEGLSEQEAMQVIEMVMQQSQAPQQEQVPQEEQMMQEGGVAIQPEVPVEMANAEIEGGEYVQDTEGVKYAEGAKHSEGGIPTQLENGARVLSDYKKVGKDLSKQLSEQLGFEVKASDTFATVLDKFNRKEGFDKKVKHLDDYSDKLEKQEKTVKHDATLALNKQILMEEAQEDTQKLQQLVKQQEGLFNMLFEAQEASKGVETEGNFLQEGGTVNDLMAKYNISAEEATKLVQNSDLEFERMKGKGYEQSNPYFFQNPGREGKLEDWTNSQMYKAEYDLGDVEAKKQRFKDLADNAGVPYTDSDFKDSKSIDAFAGKLQKFIIENKPELAIDYGKKVEPTREGLQYLVDNNIINPEEYGIKLINGKVVRGSYDTLTTEADKKLMDVISKLPQDKVKDYALTNYNDNLGYFRGIKTREQELSEEEFNKFTSENKPVGSGYYETKVPGVYVKPTKIGETKTEPVVEQTIQETPMEIPTTPIVDMAQDKERKRLNFLNLPDQTPMLPWAMQAPAMTRQTIYAPRWNEISPEQQLTDIQRGRVATAEQMSFLPDSQQASSLFALDANAMSAQNKVRSETERYNQMARERTEAAEADQKTRQSAADVVAAQTYQQQLGNELESNEADWRGWYNRVASNQMNNWDSVERANLYNAYNPNVQRTSSGYEVINEPTFTNDASKKYLAEQEKKTKKKKPVAKDGGTFRGKKSTKRFGK